MYWLVGHVQELPIDCRQVGTHELHNVGILCTDIHRIFVHTIRGMLAYPFARCTIFLVQVWESPDSP